MSINEHSIHSLTDGSRKDGRYGAVSSTSPTRKNLEEAVDLALDESIKGEYLGSYFQERRDEIKEMILEEYEEARILRVIARDAKEEGREEGIAEGKAEGLAEAQAEAEAKDLKRFQKLAAAGIDIPTIADLMEVPEETVRKALKKENSQEKR